MSIGVATITPLLAFASFHYELTHLFPSASQLHDGLHNEAAYRAVLRRMQPSRFHAPAGSLRGLAGRHRLARAADGLWLEAADRPRRVAAGATSDLRPRRFIPVQRRQRRRGDQRRGGPDPLAGQERHLRHRARCPAATPCLGHRRRNRRASLPVAPLQLFPLETGKGVKFHAARIVRHVGRDQPVTVQEDWRCEVAGTASVATQAGNFQTWRVDCAMHETPAVTGNGVVQRSFYYAPDIGFYVRTEERIGNGPTHVADLSSYTSSDPILTASALRQRSIEIQRALEAQLSGSQATWSDATTGAVGKVMLLDTRLSERYGWCRDFAERIRWSGRSYSLHGMGCRNPEKSGRSSCSHRAARGASDHGLTPGRRGFGLRRCALPANSPLRSSAGRASRKPTSVWRRPTPMPAPGCAAPPSGRTIGWRSGARRAAARPTCCTSGPSAPARTCAPAPALSGLPELPAAGIAIDDADAVADEDALLHLLNAAGEAGLPVLLAARTPPARWAAHLPDLASRLRAMTAVEIGPPEDTLLRTLLARLLADRQLRVPEPGAGMAGAAPAAQRRGAARCGRAPGCRGTRAAPQHHGAVRGPGPGGRSWPRMKFPGRRATPRRKARLSCRIAA